VANDIGYETNHLLFPPMRLAAGRWAPFEKINTK